ncbi:hypothetical protein Tco_1523986 [Tanacetum coccineum]
MDTTRAQQQALDDELVSLADRLKIDRSLTQASKGKRIKTIAKGDKPAKKKQFVTKSKGLTVLSEVALTEAEQIKLATKRSQIPTHIAPHASGSCADEGTGREEEIEDGEVNCEYENNADDADNDDDVDNDDEDDDVDNQYDEIPDDANQDDDEQTDSNNDVNEDESDEESDDESNEDSDEEVQGAILEEEEMDEEDEANELYSDVNINLEGRDIVMTHTPLPNVQGTQVTEDTHVIIIAPINPEGQQQSSSVSSGFVSNMLDPSPDTGRHDCRGPIAANLSELELKKTLIDKMESNKLIHISNEQNNLYKALIDAYESDKLILDTYGDTVSFKRRRDDEDKDEEYSAGSNRGSKRRRAGKEPKSTSAPKEKKSKTSNKSYEGSKSQHKTAAESAQTEGPMHTTKDLEEPTHQEFEKGVTEDQPNEETP